MKVAARLLAFGLALVLGAIAATPVLVERLGDRVEAAMERSLHSEVDLGRVSWTVGGLVTVEDLEVRPRGGTAEEAPLVHVDTVSFHVSPVLSAMKVRVDDLTARGVRVTVLRRQDGTDNIKRPVLGLLRTLGWGAKDESDGPGGGLGRYIQKHIPDMEVRGLKVVASSSSALAPGVPTHVVLEEGTLNATNTALLKEEDNVTIQLSFQRTNLAPRGGMQVRAVIPVRGGKGAQAKGNLEFDFPLEIPYGDRFVSLGGLAWGGGVLEIENVGLSRPGIKSGEQVEPQVWAKGIRLDVRLEELLSTIARVMAGEEVGARALMKALNRVVVERPKIYFEQGQHGHSMADLIPDGVAVEEEKAIPPHERALGHLMDATLTAVSRLRIREQDPGGGFRGFLMRGFDRLEGGVAQGSRLVSRLLEEVPFQELTVRGGYFAWRDADRSSPGRADLEGRLESFDLEVVREGDVIRFDATFLVPGTLGEANRLRGRLHRTTGDVEVRATIDRLRLEPYAHVLPRSVAVNGFTALGNTDVSWVWSPSTQLARLEGKLTLDDGVFAYRGLASRPLTGIDISLDFVAELDTARKVLVLRKSKIRVGNVDMKLEGTVAAYASSPRIEGQLEVPRTRAQDVVEALPVELIPLLEGLRVEGTLGWRLDFRIDTSDIESLDYNFHPQLTHFRVLDMGHRLNLNAVSGTFLHRIEEEDGTVREILMGRAAPTWASLDEISHHVVQAVTTTEDGSFYKHKGWSSYAIRQSLVTNLKKGGFVRGASTISQQLVKNLFLSREKTISRKLQEFFITTQLEGALDKDRIMELYLNVIEFGPGIYGIGPAAYHYFGKPPGELTALESVFLVSLIPSPKRYYHQYQRGEVDDAWRRHLRWIMKVMVQRGKLDLADFQLAAPYSPTFFDPNAEVPIPEEAQGEGEGEGEGDKEGGDRDPDGGGAEGQEESTDL